VAEAGQCVHRASGDELEVTEVALQRNAFGFERVTAGADAVLVGPADVGGVGALDRRAPARLVAFVEHLEQVGDHQLVDG
jgi:hypothetical protein